MKHKKSATSCVKKFLLLFFVVVGVVGVAVPLSSRTSWCRSELARSPQARQNWFPRGWKSSHSGSHPHLQGCQWPWSGKISPSLPNCQRSCQEEVQPRISDRRCEVNQQSRYGLRGVRIGEASNPGPQSTSIDSDEEPILPGRFRPWSHSDSAD